MVDEYLVATVREYPATQEWRANDDPRYDVAPREMPRTLWS